MHQPALCFLDPSGNLWIPRDLCGIARDLKDILIVVQITNSYYCLSLVCCYIQIYIQILSAMCSYTVLNYGYYLIIVLFLNIKGLVRNYPHSGLTSTSRSRLLSPQSLMIRCKRVILAHL